jgi:hypothetical protein
MTLDVLVAIKVFKWSLLLPKEVPLHEKHESIRLTLNSRRPDIETVIVG